MTVTVSGDIQSRSDQKKVIDKLLRVRGRIDGLIRMIENGRNPEDTLMQVSATHEALRVVAKSIVKQHIEQAIPTGLTSTNTNKRNIAYDELIDVLYKYVK